MLLIAAIALFGSLLGLFVSGKVHDSHKPDPCLLLSSGADDGPRLLRAIRSCPKTTIPVNTTLDIQTRLNTTGLQNRHIVRLFNFHMIHLTQPFAFASHCKAQFALTQTFHTGPE